ALTSSAGVPIATPNAVQGIIAGTTQDVSFAAVDPGTYYLGCLVPGLPGVPGAGPTWGAWCRAISPRACGITSPFPPRPRRQRCASDRHAPPAHPVWAQGAPAAEPGASGRATRGHAGAAM